MADASVLGVVVELVLALPVHLSVPVPVHLPVQHQQPEPQQGHFDEVVQPVPVDHEHEHRLGDEILIQHWHRCRASCVVTGSATASSAACSRGRTSHWCFVSLSLSLSLAALVLFVKRRDAEDGGGHKPSRLKPRVVREKTGCRRRGTQTKPIEAGILRF